MSQPQLEIVRADRIVSEHPGGRRRTGPAASRDPSRGGARVIEVSLVTAGVLDVGAEVARQPPNDILIGVGTVVASEQVVAASQAGARFVVSPTNHSTAISEGVRSDLLTIPGEVTPSEALTASQAEAPIQKLLPESQWTPSSMRDVLVAVPELQLVPTRVVALATTRDWLDAGAVGVGLGSALLEGGRDVGIRLIARLRREVGSD